MISFKEQLSFSLFFETGPFLQGHLLLIFIINPFSRKWDAVLLPTSSGTDKFGNGDAVMLTVSMKSNGD